MTNEAYENMCRARAATAEPVHELMMNAVSRIRRIIERAPGASYRTLATRCMYGPSRKAHSAQRRIMNASRQAIREMNAL